MEPRQTGWVMVVVGVVALLAGGGLWAAGSQPGEAQGCFVFWCFDPIDAGDSAALTWGVMVGAIGVAAVLFGALTVLVNRPAGPDPNRPPDP